MAGVSDVEDGAGVGVGLKMERRSRTGAQVIENRIGWRSGYFWDENIPAPLKPRQELRYLAL
jgi:hypothetical protein